MDLFKIVVYTRQECFQIVHIILFAVQLKKHSRGVGVAKVPYQNFLDMEQITYAYNGFHYDGLKLVITTGNY